MKKTCYAALIVLAVFSFIGCTTTNVEVPYDVTPTIQGEKLVEMTIVPSFGQDSLWTGWSNAKGTKGYALVMKNISKEVVTIDWSKSSISYGSSSSTIFQEGQKYIDSNSPMPPLVLTVGGEQIRVIYAASQVHYAYSVGWKLNVIPTYNTIVTICVTSSKGDSYYIFDIKSPIIAD